MLHKRKFYSKAVAVFNRLIIRHETGIKKYTHIVKIQFLITLRLTEVSHQKCLFTHGITV